MGGSVLAYPYLMRNTGLLSGLSLIFFGMILMLSSIFVLVLSSRLSGQCELYDISNRLFGPRLRLFVISLVTIACLLSLVAFVIMSNDIFFPIVQPWMPSPPPSWLAYAIKIGTLVLTFPLTFLPSLHALRHLNNLSNVAILCLICVLIYRSVEHFGDTHIVSSLCDKTTKTITRDVSSDNISLIFPYGISGLLISLPMSMTGFVCHATALRIHAELYNPTRARLLIALMISFFIAFSIYALAGLAGYAFAVEATCTNILLNFLPNDSFATVARLMLAFIVLGNIPMQLLPARKAILHLIRALSANTFCKTLSKNKIAAHLASAAVSRQDALIAAIAVAFLAQAEMDKSKMNKKLNNIEMDCSSPSSPVVNYLGTLTKKQTQDGKYICENKDDNNLDAFNHSSSPIGVHIIENNDLLHLSLQKNEFNLYKSLTSEQLQQSSAIYRNISGDSGNNSTKEAEAEIDENEDDFVPSASFLFPPDEEVEEEEILSSQDTNLSIDNKKNIVENESHRPFPSLKIIPVRSKSETPNDSKSSRVKSSLSTSPFIPVKKHFRMLSFSNSATTNQLRIGGRKFPSVAIAALNFLTEASNFKDGQHEVLADISHRMELNASQKTERRRISSALHRQVLMRQQQQQNMLSIFGSRVENGPTNNLNMPGNLTAVDQNSSTQDEHAVNTNPSIPSSIRPAPLLDLGFEWSDNANYGANASNVQMDASLSTLVKDVLQQQKKQYDKKLETIGEGYETRDCYFNNTHSNSNKSKSELDQTINTLHKSESLCPKLEDASYLCTGNAYDDSACSPLPLCPGQHYHPSSLYSSIEAPPLPLTRAHSAIAHEACLSISKLVNLPQLARMVQKFAAMKSATGSLDSKAQDTACYERYYKNNDCTKSNAIVSENKQSETENKQFTSRVLPVIFHNNTVVNDTTSYSMQQADSVSSTVEEFPIESSADNSIGDDTANFNTPEFTDMEREIACVIHDLLASTDPSSLVQPKVLYLFNFCFCLCVGVLGCFVTNIVTIYSFAGSVVSVCTTMILPALFYLKVTSANFIDEQLSLASAGENLNVQARKALGDSTVVTAGGDFPIIPPLPNASSSHGLLTDLSAFMPVAIQTGRSIQSVSVIQTAIQIPFPSSPNKQGLNSNNGYNFDANVNLNDNTSLALPLITTNNDNDSNNNINSLLTGGAAASSSGFILNDRHVNVRNRRNTGISTFSIRFRKFLSIFFLCFAPPFSAIGVWKAIQSFGAPPCPTLDQTTFKTAPSTATAIRIAHEEDVEGQFVIYGEAFEEYSDLNRVLDSYTAAENDSEIESNSLDFSVDKSLFLVMTSDEFGSLDAHLF